MVVQRRKSLNVEMLWQIDIAQHLGTFHILSHPLQSAIRSVLFVLDTNWPQPYGVNPSVETVGNWHTTRTCRVLDRPPRTTSESSNFSIKGSLIRRRLHPHVGLLSWTA